MKTPTMVYKFPGKHQMQDGFYDYLIVDAGDVEAALKDGWSSTKEEARQSFDKAHPAVEPAAEATPDAPPTRAELEQKAKEIGVKFDGRTTDKKLAALIAEKV